MKHLASVCLLFVLAFSCRKENNTIPPPPAPPEDLPEWTIFNTANSKLPDNQVNTLTIDRQDTKWLGTSKGLIRFQHDEWTVFNSSNSPLPSDYVQALAAEEDGTLWIGTTGGLARLKDNNWQVYTKDNSQLPQTAIMSLVHDVERKITYIGTDGSTVSISNGDHWKILEDSGNPVFSLAVDKNGVLWSGSFNFFAFTGRIRRYESGQWSSLNLPDHGYPSAFPYSLTIGNDNHALVALSGTAVRSVVRVNGSSLEEIPYSSNAESVRAIVADGDQVWLAGQRLSLLGSREQPALTIPGIDSPIQAIAIDSKGSKWLGTVYGGLVRYHKK